jgi:phage terminase small subunit
MLQGLMIMGQTQMVKNPILQNLGQASDRILELAKQLGMTWMTRARTPLAQETPTSGNGNPFSGEQATGS